MRWTAMAKAGVVYFAAEDVTGRRAAEIERDRTDSLSTAITDA